MSTKRKFGRFKFNRRPGPAGAPPVGFALGALETIGLHHAKGRAEDGRPFHLVAISRASFEKLCRGEMAGMEGREFGATDGSLVLLCGAETDEAIVEAFSAMKKGELPT